MTEGQERLRLARERFDCASKAVSDHIGRATVAGAGEESSAGAPLDAKWGDELDRLETELNGAIGELMMAAREVLGESAAGGR